MDKLPKIDGSPGQHSDDAAILIEAETIKQDELRLSRAKKHIKVMNELFTQRYGRNG